MTRFTLARGVRICVVLFGDTANIRGVSTPRVAVTTEPIAGGGAAEALSANKFLTRRAFVPPPSWDSLGPIGPKLLCDFVPFGDASCFLLSSPRDPHAPEQPAARPPVSA